MRRLIATAACVRTVSRASMSASDEEEEWTWDTFTAPTCVRACKDLHGTDYIIAGDRHGNITVHA